MVKLIISFEEVFLVYTATALMLNIKWKYALISSLVIALIAYPILNVSGILACIFMVVCIIGLMKIQGAKWINAIGVSSYVLIIAILMDSANSVVLTMLSSHLSFNITYEHWLAIPFTTVFYLLAFSVMYLVNKFSRMMMNKMNTLHINKHLKSVFLIVLISAISFLVYAHINPFDMFDDSMMFLITAIFVSLISGIMILIVVWGITQVQKRQKDVELRHLTEYTSKLEETYQNIRMFRHDYLNILTSMYGFIENKDMEGLAEHFDEIVLPYNKQITSENISLSALSNIKIAPLKGLLSSKMMVIYLNKLNHKVEVIEPIENINVNPIDLCRMIGILLDNSIEAAIESEEKLVEIAVFQEQGDVVIIIKNSCNKNVLPVHLMYEKGQSTKGNERGLGLYNYKLLAKQNDNVLTETVVEDNTVQQIVRIN